MAKNLLPEIPLTEPDRAMRDRRRLTRPGMASWGGEGPAGTYCFRCSWWKRDGHKATTGELRDGECRKYTLMMNGRKGPRVPPQTATCRYFELAEKAPSLYDGVLFRSEP